MDMDVSNENNNAKYYAHNQQHSCDDWMRFALTPLPSLDNADHDRSGRLEKIVKIVQSINGSLTGTCCSWWALSTPGWASLPGRATSTSTSNSGGGELTLTIIVTKADN